MAQSLNKIFLHIIFHIKTTSPKILDEHMERLHGYLGQLINTTGCQSVHVGGIDNHIHAVCMLSRNETVSHLVEEMKRNSNRWLKTLSPHYKTFEWQRGYAAFSVSKSVVDKVIDYVSNQKEHHKRMTFEEEYLKLLELHNIDYDERYVFAD